MPLNLCIFALFCHIRSGSLIDYGMSSMRSRAIISYLRTFFERHKKVIICTAALFVVGIVLGIVLAYKAVDGEFESVPRVDVETGSAKIFFFAILSLVGCYGVILIAGINDKTAILICVPFVVLGFVMGRFAIALIMRYDGFGVINLLFVYLPFFLATFALMLIASARVLSAACYEHCEGSTLKPSFVAALKLFGLNAAVALVCFAIVGSICGGVIVVTLF